VTVATAVTTIRIERSVEDVFAIVSDVEKDPTYSTMVIEARRTSAGRIGIGATATLTSEVLGRRMINDWVITEFEPNVGFAWQSTSGPRPRVGGSMFLEPLNGATLLRVTTVTESRGILKLADHLVVRIAIRQFRRDLASLKRLMEEGTP
jgi:hypothetical protein